VVQLHAQRHERSVEDGIPNIAVAEHRQIVNRLPAVWANESKVNGRRRLQLNFEQALLDIRKLPIVLPHKISEVLADGFVQRATVLAGASAK
jgi:hypothetical protein